MVLPNFVIVTSNTLCSLHGDCYILQCESLFDVVVVDRRDFDNYHVTVLSTYTNVT